MSVRGVWLRPVSCSAIYQRERVDLAWLVRSGYAGSAAWWGNGWGNAHAVTSEMTTAASSSRTVPRSASHPRCIVIVSMISGEVVVGGVAVPQKFGGDHIAIGR